MTKGHQVLAAVCVAEAATGLGLIVAPSVVASLLLGSAVTGTAIIISNVAGIALVALAASCWPSASGTGAYAGMLIYVLLVALLLAESGLAGKANGRMLWPAIVLHIVFSILITWAWLARRRGEGDRV